ncbi:hypothetical protein ADIARSV_0808 [Arcticibacter svalbardensis MN12-7]|uniref:Uncharacterized protein n=1 Tax=Arcticibacter svalbardensis MN12-7 TaxID=1150600 RepID=R9GVX6_9SPHI|nr:hypothetical protein ADIARSV_0808 [Arcticibacter svalbardensis MN12-7]
MLSKTSIRLSIFPPLKTALADLTLIKALRQKEKFRFVR